MSELKDYDIMDIEAMDDERLEKSESGKIQVTRVYIKSEADKVIAELKKACNDKDDWCLHTLKELRHSKYKRCLANAEACMHKRWRHDEGFDYARSTRHMNKWLELAEKFKEAK